MNITTKQILVFQLLFYPLLSWSTSIDDMKPSVLLAQIEEDSTILSKGEIYPEDKLKNKRKESDEIVHFDMNVIPVDYDLFKYHVSTKEFIIPMDYNNHVKKQIDYYGTRWQSKLKEMISKSEYIFPVYEEILNEYNVPLEVVYLSIIESALNPHAVSRSGAVGAWQFMPATGRIFKLNENSTMDERRSIEKSTRAACIYLNQMHNKFGDWLVALASYNCGPGNVRKAIRLSGSTDFWGMYRYLPKQTQNYVPKFIAMTYMMSFYSEYGITAAPIDTRLYEYDQIYCQEGIYLSMISEKLNISQDVLLKLNPELKNTEIPYKGEGYFLYIPKNMAALYYAMEDEIFGISLVLAEEQRIEDLKKPKYTYYYVKKGESLPLIARRQGCTVAQLRKWNGIKGSLIHPKQRLKIYK